jgi:hypothetical protein
MAPDLQSGAGMSNRLTIACFASLLIACTAGDDGKDPDVFKPEPIDPNPNKLVCSAAFRISGTWTAGTPARPTDPNDPNYAEGCWPVGIWTFTATVDNEAEVLDITGDEMGDRCGTVAGTSPPMVAPTGYSFQFNREPEIDNNGTPDDTTDDAVLGWKDNIVMMTGVAVADVIRLKVSEGGGGECEGGLEFDDDTNKKVWNLKPALTGTTLGGFGEFTQYIDAQR